MFGPQRQWPHKKPHEKMLVIENALSLIKLISIKNCANETMLCKEGGGKIYRAGDKTVKVQVWFPGGREGRLGRGPPPSEDM